MGITNEKKTRDIDELCLQLSLSLRRSLWWFTGRDFLEFVNPFSSGIVRSPVQSARSSVVPRVVFGAMLQFCGRVDAFAVIKTYGLCNKKHAAQRHHSSACTRIICPFFGVAFSSLKLPSSEVVFQLPTLLEAWSHMFFARHCEDSSPVGTIFRSAPSSLWSDALVLRSVQRFRSV